MKHFDDDKANDRAINLLGIAIALVAVLIPYMEKLITSIFH
jgi:hypothetical protein